MVKADEAGPGILGSVRQAFQMLSQTAAAEKNFVVAASFYERLLVVQESLHNVTIDRGNHKGGVTAYLEGMQSSLAKLGLRKSPLLLETCPWASGLLRVMLLV